MARVEHLQIYRTSYELLKYITIITKDFPKDYKFTLGQKLKEEMIDLILQLFKANNAQNKIPHLEISIERLQTVQMLLRLCKDMQFISVHQFSETVKHTDSISKQSAGWCRYNTSTQSVVD